jgi:putative transposase
MTKRHNKTKLAKELGISRSSLYYRSRLKERDEVLRRQILAVLSEHPSYGHRRLALQLKRNRKYILRVMKKFAIKPYRRRMLRPRKRADEGQPALLCANIARTLCPLRRNVLWASDFTYLWFQNRYWYLATVIDLFSREVVGFSFAGSHDKHLVLHALQMALEQRSAPHYLHSDQGSEYTSYAYLDLLRQHQISASFSTKASPWQNGYQESFYSEFKKDLGDLSRFETIALFLEALYQQLHYYNHHRLHTALKTTPSTYHRTTVLKPEKVS